MHQIFEHTRYTLIKFLGHLFRLVPKLWVVVTQMFEIWVTTYDDTNFQGIDTTNPKV